MLTTTPLNTVPQRPEIPVLIAERDVLHRAGSLGVKIGKVQTIVRPDGATVEVDFWYNYTPQGAKLHHVAEPRVVAEPAVIRVTDDKQALWRVWGAEYAEAYAGAVLHAEIKADGWAHVERFGNHESGAKFPPSSYERL